MLTKQGNLAYQGHIRALRAIVAGSPLPDPTTESATDLA